MSVTAPQTQQLTAQFHTLQQSVIDACAQCVDFISELDHKGFTASSSERSSIGAHTRHVIDFMLCFFKGLETGVIDYDARERHEGTEKSPETATSLLHHMQKRFHMLTLEDEREHLQVSETVNSEGEKVAVPTSLNRELMMLLSHTIHHLGIMKILAEDLGFSLGNNVGKAHATVVYEQQQA